MSIMAERKLSELPVIDADSKPVGLLDITDLMSDHPPATISGDPTSTDCTLNGLRLLQQSNDHNNDHDNDVECDIDVSRPSD